MKKSQFWMKQLFWNFVRYLMLVIVVVLAWNPINDIIKQDIYQLHTVFTIVLLVWFLDLIFIFALKKAKLME